MSLTPEELHRIAARTLAHDDRQAQTYREDTRDHDVSQNIGALLAHIGVPAPFDLLDFGCGPGRDLITFKALGHRPIPARGRGRQPVGRSCKRPERAQTITVQAAPRPGRGGRLCLRQFATGRSAGAVETQRVVTDSKDRIKSGECHARWALG